MSDIQVFSIASQKARWLGDRQAVVASNVANASTPGFKAKDVAPFSAIMAGTKSGLTRTNSRHLNIAGSTQTLSGTEIRTDPNGTTSHSGNSVSVERELIKGGEVTAAYSLNASIVKSFQKMILMSVRR